jgi:HPt (histidine-containing phosphotransfer) domain-containing protein
VSGARKETAMAGAAGTTGAHEALARLEAAVEQLSIAAAKPRVPAMPAGEGVPREQVQAIADRLDETIARLRNALGDES